MLVDELLLNISDLNGIKIGIEGIFVMRESVGYFVANRGEIENFEKAIYVEVTDLKKVLLSKVPAFGGGFYSYCNDAAAVGIVKEVMDKDFRGVLINIEQMEIYVSGEKFTVI